QKIVAEKTISSPDEFEFAAEHPEHEHVHEDVPDAIGAVKKEVGDGLPDAQTRNDAARNQAKPHFEQVFGDDSPEVMDEELKKIDGEIGDDQKLHTRSDVKIEAEAIGTDVGARGHAEASLRAKSRRSKGGVRPRDGPSASIFQSSFLRAK